MKTCVICGQVFIRTGKRQKTCAGECRKRLNLAHSQKWANRPENRQRLRKMAIERYREIMRNPVRRDRELDRVRKYKSNPEYRKKHRDYMRKPENREKSRLLSRLRQQTDEYRKQDKEAKRKRREDPICREQINKLQRAYRLQKIHSAILAEAAKLQELINERA